MKKVRLYIFGRWLLIFSLLFWSCASSKPTASEMILGGESASGPPEQVYTPSYYTYKNGKYTFSKGRYERVLSRKAYHERNLKGYMYKDKRERSRAARRKTNSNRG
jgi:hypothetical protein